MILVDRRRAGVIGREREQHLIGAVLVAGQQISQILRSAFGVLLRIFRVDAQNCERYRASVASARSRLSAISRPAGNRIPPS